MKFFSYIVSAGVNNFKTKLAKSKLNSTIELLKPSDDEFDKFILKITSFKFMKSSIKFTLGEEFDENSFCGRKVKSSITFDDNKMIHNQKIINQDKTIVIERRFFVDMMITIYRISDSDVTCTIWYQSND